MPNHLSQSALTSALPLESLFAKVSPSSSLTGKCPNGKPSLPIECDPKRPWPQCPPQSYCYATNTVDIGPYYCCPICINFIKLIKKILNKFKIFIGSTYGAAWRPTSPFFDHSSSLPLNWPSSLHFSNSFSFKTTKKKVFK